MSRISPDELTRAIELAQLDEVKRLIAEGANPYQPNSSGQSALEVWQDSQKKGNPYAGLMGLALLERGPADMYEKFHLYKIQDAQVGNLAQALGVLEHARQVGIDYYSAYIPPQTLESSQACWAAVYQAVDKLQDSPPTTDIAEFAQHFAVGLEKGRKLLVRVPHSSVANLNATVDESVRPDIEEVRTLGRLIRKGFSEDLVSISPRGAIMSADGRGEGLFLSLAGLRKADGHKAAVFHSDDLEYDPNIWAGMPKEVWFGRTPEQRLDQALDQKDWQRAATLVQRGADINRLPLDRSLERLIESPSAQETQALLDMGLDPFKRVPTFRSAEPTLPIHQAQSQEQFDLLWQRMMEIRPNLPPFSPQSNRTREFWEKSPHFVDTRSASIGSKVGEWVEELAGLTKSTIANWRKARQPAGADHEPTKPQGPKP